MKHAEKVEGTTRSPSIIEDILSIDSRFDVESTFKDLGPGAIFLRILRIIGLPDRYAPHQIRWWLLCSPLSLGIAARSMI